MTDTILHRALPAGSTTLDIEARTIEVIFATEQPVRRRSWEGQFDEVLVVTAAAIDSGRMDAMSVLDSHRANSLADRIGSVVPGSLKIVRGEARCTIRLSRSEKAELLLQDLRDGHTLPISVGYRIHEEKRTEAPSGGVATVRATKWEPLEISVVPIPADAGAMTRELENEGKTDMTDTQAITRAEKKRQAEIRGLAKSSGIEADHELVGRAIEDDQTVDAFRAALLDHLIERENTAPTFPIASTRGMRDAQETTRTLMANAIMHRHGLTSKLEDGAGQFRDLTLVELGRELLQLRGHDHRGPASEVVRRALHSTSDFPHILGDVTRKTLLQQYAAIPNTFQLIGNRNVVPDLREVTVVDLGNGPALEPLSESGEYKRGSAKDSSETFKMGHYGRVLGLTEAMIINDQLGAFARLIQTWAVAAARLEGDLAWAPILQNAKLNSDGKELFHADHGNLAAAGTALTEIELIKGRTALRSMTDIDGQRLPLTAKYVFVGTPNEVPAQKLISSTTNPATTDQAVPEAIKNLVPVFEHRIDKLKPTAFFMFSDPVETFGRGLQYALLAGYEQPRLKSREGFDQDGLEFRLDHYFGAGLTDYRFAYYNPGN